MLRLMKHSLVFLLFALSSVFAQADKYHELALEGIAQGHNLQINKAEAIFNEMIALDPNHPLGYLAQALTNLYGHQFEENQKTFEKKFTDYTETAIKLARKNLSSQPRPVEALFHLGVAYVFLGFYHGERSNWLRALWYGKQGIDYLEQVIASDTSYYDAYLGLGAYHYYADPRRLKFFVKNGAALLGYKGDRKKGLRELQLAAEKGVYARPEALFLLGFIYFGENDYEKALRYFEALAQQYPDNPFFALALVGTLQNTGNYSRAVEIANRVVAQKSDNRNLAFHMQSYYCLGKLYFDLNQFETAVANYTKALATAVQVSGKTKGLVASANFNLGHSYEMLGKREEAIPYYRQIKESDDKYAYQNAKKHLEQPHLPVEEKIIRGENYFKTKNYDQALEVFEAAYAKALENTDDYPSREISGLLFNIGNAQYEKKNYAEAIAVFTKILALKNIEEKWIEPRAHFNLGNCHREMGDKQKAEVEYETAYKYDDDWLRLEIDKAREKDGSKFLKN